MASVVAISNRALQKLGAKRITAIDQEAVNARACNSCYEAVRDALLEDHIWGFSILQASLAADSTAPEWGKNYKYALPSDFIRLAPDFEEDIRNNKDWVIQSGFIYSDDSAPLYIRYVSRVTDPNFMTPLFRELLSHDMACEMAEELTQSNAKKADLQAQRRDIISRAKKSQAFQRISQEPPEDTYLSVRI